MTKLTWRATRVDASGVRYTVQARTLDVEGATLSTVENAEFHPAGDPPPPPGPKAVFAVGGVAVEAQTHVVRETGGDVTLSTSGSVPFSGLVQSTSPSAEQRLVAFGRGP